jgi:hypothetical protein
MDMTQRPRRRGIWITVAVLTALVVLVPAGVQVWGRLIDQSHTDAVSYQHPIRALEIDSPNGDVRVGAGPAGQVNVRRTLSWALSRPTVRQTWDGDTLRISVACHRKELYSSLECGVALDLRVPADVAVRASVRSGQIDVRAITGGLHLEATSGQVYMADVSGDIWARARSGTVTGAALTATTVRTEVNSGRIRLGFTGPPEHVTATTGSGGVSIGVPPGVRYRVDGRTGSGSRHVDPTLVDAASSRAITMTTGSGSATLGYPSP